MYPLNTTLFRGQTLQYVFLATFHKIINKMLLVLTDATLSTCDLGTKQPTQNQ